MFISGFSILFHWSIFLSLCQYHTVLMTVALVVEPEVRKIDSSSSILLSQDCFGYSRFFVFPYKLWNYSSSVKNIVGSLIALYGLHWIYRLHWEVSSFWQYWFFQSMNKVYFSIYLFPLWFLSSVFYSFLCIGLLFL